MLIFRESAFDHGVTREKIEDVLANKTSLTQWFEIHEDSYGNSQDMVVGFDADGNNLLEIGVTYIDEVVFHAMKATKAFEDLYNGS